MMLKQVKAYKWPEGRPINWQQQ